jgi:hypothetical protein
MFKTMALIVGMCLSSACLASDVRLIVAPDGSGTVTYTMKLSPSRMAEMDKLFPPGPGEQARPSVESLFQSDPRLVGRMAGPYARLRSARSLKSLDSVGREVIVEFDDVSKLEVELLPAVPGGMGLFYSIAAADPHAPRPRLGLSMAPAADGNQVLTVRFPKFAMDPSAEPPGAAVTGPPAEMAQLRDAVKGTRMTIAVETATPLIRTNSPHVEGNRVVLVDIDLEAALFSRQIDMLRAAPASFDEYLWMLGDLPGVKLASDHVITIEFQDSTQPAAAVQQPPPSTEIFLATLTRNGNRLTLGSPVNITNSDGYDNQPSFTPDGASILFASGRRSDTTGTTAPGGGTPQTDIYRYDIAARQIVRVTATPESEFSPTVMPDGKRLSVVRVEANGTQRLWSFTPDGNDAALVLSEIKPVGYHAWIDQHTLALFVLGQPATLQVADIATGKAEVVAQDIGRSIQRMPGGRISFVQRGSRVANVTPVLTLTELSITKDNDKDQTRLRFQTSALVPPVGGATEPYPVWLPDGTALMAHANTLSSWRPGQAAWVPIADLGSLGLKDVTRLALSPKADRLALVAAGR